MHSKRSHKICICSVIRVASYAGIFRGARGSSLPTNFVGREEIRASLKRPAWEAIIRGELEDFRNYKGFTVIFLKSLDGIERFAKVRIFLIPHVHSIISLNPKILGFLFATKISLSHWE